MELEQRNTKVVRAQSGRPLLITFSGIDGTGKTTQIEKLAASLRDAGIKVQLIRFWDDVALLRRSREWMGHRLFKGDKGIGTPERPVERRDKNVSNWYMPTLRLFLCSLDAVGNAIMMVKFRLRATADLVIFDRYVYDQIANLNLTNRRVQAFARTVLRLIPRPDVPCLLDADPELARLRKPEYPIGFLRQNRQSYLMLGEIAGMVVIPAGSIEEVATHVRRAVVGELSRLQHFSIERLSINKI